MTKPKLSPEDRLSRVRRLKALRREADHAIERTEGVFWASVAVAIAEGVPQGEVAYALGVSREWVRLRTLPYLVAMGRKARPEVTL